MRPYSVSLIPTGGDAVTLVLLLTRQDERGEAVEDRIPLGWYRRSTGDLFEVIVERATRLGYNVERLRLPPAEGETT